MVIMHGSDRSILQRRTVWFGLFWLCLLVPAPVFSDEPVGTDSPAKTAENDADGPDPTKEIDTPAKRQALSLAVFMLGGIIVAGTLLLILVVMWGNRTRRLAQSALPPVAKRDELWFLKPKKDSAEEPAGDDSHQ